MDKINFQNGTLLSNAKVEVGGIIYDVTPAQYEGTTPLSAQNLNQMQDNAENAINEVQTNLNTANEKIYTETTLFEGSSSEPTLSDSITNYEYIDIVINDNRGRTTERVYNPSVGMEVSHIAGSYDGWIYIRIHQYTLADKQIKLNSSNPKVTLQGGSGTSLAFSTSTTRNILKVIGYKKGSE